MFPPHLTQATRVDHSSSFALLVLEPDQNSRVFALQGGSAEWSCLMKKALAATAVVALLAAGSVTLTASSASAEVVCNKDGDCWHVKDHYTYPDVTIQIHPDDWKWGANDKFKWHENDKGGRGYWKGGVWIGF
jgi:hypothetical protein